MNLETNKFDQIWDDLKSEFSSTIKECSFDEDNKVYLIDLDLEKVVVCFDDVAKNWAKDENKLDCETPKSMDCLYVKDKKLCLVEFKNKKHIKKREYLNGIKPKIHDTLSILNYYYGFEKSDFAGIEVMIVHKEKEVSPKKESHNRLSKIADSSCPPSLEFLQKVYRIKISKITSVEFLENLQYL